MQAEITPRPGDGRISRDDAARLAGVLPGTISQWIRREYISDVRYEGRRPWFNPREIIEAEHRLHERERERAERRRELLGVALRDQAPEQPSGALGVLRRLRGRRSSAA